MSAKPEPPPAMRLLIAGLIALVSSVAPSDPARAQSTLERTPLLDGGWTGVRGMLYADVTTYFDQVAREGIDLVAAPTYRTALSLPADLLAGASLTPNTPIGGGEAWDVFLRWAPMPAGRGDLSLAATASYAGGPRSVDGEVSGGAWIGPVRALGALRAFSDFLGQGEAEVSGALGAAVHLAEGRVPIALAGDVGRVLTLEGADLVWSAGVQVGLSFTDYTLSLHLTNALAPTRQGAAVAAERQAAFEATLPVPVGRFFGWYAPRERALAGVAEVAPSPASVGVEAEISRYAYWPMEVEVEAGTVVTWVNRDAVVHTVSADDGAFGSGAIPPAQRWSARFDEPGIYPFHCGPHPFMQGVVVVH